MLTKYNHIHQNTSTFLHIMSNVPPDIPSDIEDEFNELDDDPDEQVYTTFLSATDLVNECKNRYNNNLPNECTRIKLEEIYGYGSDYINANLVQNESNDKSVILTQAPIRRTFEDFWRMVCENDVPVVIMLTKLQENGRLKADQYWPKMNQEQKFTHLTIKAIKEKMVDNDITIRTFILQYGSTVRSVTHIHYTGWPDFGAPKSTKSSELLFELEKKYRDKNGYHGPPVLHCSAGLGRAGTFASIMFVMHELDSRRNPDVKHIVQHIRSQRHSCVQTAHQYGFIYTFMNNYKHWI
jgi:protein tyrosine phosphatase